MKSNEMQSRNQIGLWILKKPMVHKEISAHFSTFFFFFFFILLIIMRFDLKTLLNTIEYKKV